MNLRMYLYVLILFLSSFCVLSAQVPERIDGVDDSVQKFLAPVRITHEGLNSFFGDIFNKDRYIERILPACFAHVIDFLEYAPKVADSRAYVLSVLEVFHQRIKGAQWVQAFAFLLFLEQVPRLLGDVCMYRSGDTADKKELVKTCLYDALLSRFSELKADPEGFIDSVSAGLVDDLDVVYAKEKQAALVVQEVRASATRFIESALDKLIWSPDDGPDVWASVKALCQGLELCLDYKILPDSKSLNALIWSVLYRFGYFIECVGSQLDVRCYDDIKKDLECEGCSFLLLPEPEQAMTTKIEYLVDCVKKGEIKHHAYKQGILSDALL